LTGTSLKIFWCR